jgi:hypothetical protein
MNTIEDILACYLTEMELGYLEEALSRLIEKHPNVTLTELLNAIYNLLYY